MSEKLLVLAAQVSQLEQKVKKGDKSLAPALAAAQASLAAAQAGAGPGSSESIRSASAQRGSMIGTSTSLFWQSDVARALAAVGQGDDARLRVACRPAAELIATEVSYGTDLGQLSSKVFPPLAEVLPEDAGPTLWQNWRILESICRVICETLHEALTAEAAAHGGEVTEQAAVRAIASVFSDHAALFKAYGRYVSGYVAALNEWQRLRADRPEVARLCASLEDPSSGVLSPPGARISDFLVKPLQRVCKYPLLFRELGAIGSPELQRTAEKIAAVVAQVNEAKRRADETALLADLAKLQHGADLAGLPIDHLLQEGEVTTPRGRAFDYFLFRRYLLLATPRALAHVVPLATASITDMDEEGLSFTIRVGDTVIVACSFASRGLFNNFGGALNAAIEESAAADPDAAAAAAATTAAPKEVGDGSTTTPIAAGDVRGSTLSRGKRRLSAMFRRPSKGPLVEEGVSARDESPVIVEGVATDSSTTTATPSTANTATAHASPPVTPPTAVRGVPQPTTRPSAPPVARGPTARPSAAPSSRTSSSAGTPPASPVVVPRTSPAPLSRTSQTRLFGAQLTQAIEAEEAATATTVSVLRDLTGDVLSVRVPGGGEVDLRAAKAAIGKVLGSTSTSTLRLSADQPDGGRRRITSTAALGEALSSGWRLRVIE